MKNSFWLVIIPILIVGVLCAIAYSALLPSPTPAPATSGVKYDAKKTLSGTRVTVAFPKDGYHGQGVELGQSRATSLMVLEKIANLYITSKPNESPQVEIGVYDLGDNATLEEAIQMIAEQQMPEASNGEYQTINGTRYYLLYSPDNYSRSAYTIVDGNLVNIKMFYTLNDDAANLPTLFAGLLEHMDFTCTTDCSVNAGPVKDTGKQGEE